jgi:hypothetical protein
MLAGMNRSVASASIFVLILTLLSRAQETPSEPAATSAEQAEESRKASAEEVQRFSFAFAGKPGAKLKLNETPVLRYTNPLRGDVHSALYIWTHEGRPEVVASVSSWYSPRRYLGLAASSLSLDKVVGLREDQLIWQPNRPGLELRPVPGARAPAATPAGRLRQMSAMAREFSAEFKREASINEGGKLRLMSRPLYRYESTSPEVQDGALFALADGTSPQLNLVIESRQTATGYEWQYALAPNNSVEYHVFHGEREVWSLPQLAPPWPNSKNPLNTYTVFADLQNEGRTGEFVSQLSQALRMLREGKSPESP